MDQLRKFHNLCKRELIEKHVKPGQLVLDCGCGRGGDLHKWRGVRCRLVCIDPDVVAVAEAKERARGLRVHASFQVGDIRTVTGGPFDVVCYNFSLHYIAANPEVFKESVDALVRNVKPGGLLIGIVPDPDRLPCEYFRDRLGNTVVREGDVLKVKVVDGPFYSGNELTEPILHPKSFKEFIQKHFVCREWSPMTEDHGDMISQIYSKFLFIRI
jgi:SAM-dependent methyltransferase